jgi:membrane complex biogenesis BtpA family protein
MFGRDRTALVGMVHLGALPGAPAFAGRFSDVLDAAVRDAEALLEGGCDALLVENMGDLPWLRGHVPPWTTASMAIAVDRVVRLGAPVGVQILAAANQEALGVAVAAGAQFVRAEAFAWAHVADEGWIDACAGELLRARAALGSRVQIWADVQKKHAAHAVTADVGLAGLAEGTAFAGADVLIATGPATGQPTDPADLAAIRSAGRPVAVGSGVTPHNAAALSGADAWIVGSWLKVHGDWRNPVDPARVRALASLARG